MSKTDVILLVQERSLLSAVLCENVYRLHAYMLQINMKDVFGIARLWIFVDGKDDGNVKAFVGFGHFLTKGLQN